MKKNTLKALVIIGLFSTSVFADGDMGGGGLLDNGTDARNTKTVITMTTEDGDMGGGGRLADQTYLETLMTSIYDYFGWTE